MFDLKRLNRILEVNEKYGYALVEPGVSYFQLHRHLRQIGSKLWIDPAAPGWGGVMGNALEHGAGYTPYGDHFVMQCGMEVVLADGEIVRTGQGAIESSKHWQSTKHAAGPHFDGMFTQSNFGVVTKMGIWLMPEPPGYKPFMITYEREEDLAAIFDAVKPLKVNQVIPNAAVAVDLLWEVSAKTTRRHYFDGKGPIPDSIRKKIASDHGLGMWNFYAALYGPPPIIENNWKLVEEAMMSIPGAKLHLNRDNDPAWDYRVRDLGEIVRAPETFTEWLARLGLDELGERRLSELSGGEQKAAHLAMAFASLAEPFGTLLLLDEPAASLDVGRQMLTASAIRRFAQAGGATVVATHDLSFARSCDIVVILAEGRLVGVGAPSSALAPEIIAATWGA
jgi:4-cresol dehydrogenase (hydroxylating)